MSKKALRMELGERSYGIIIEEGSLSKLNEYMNLCRRVAIVTDSGVPSEYARCVASQCKDSTIITFNEGEINKNIDTYAYICKEMLTFGLQRGDAVVAVGGGVTGDMAGFAAATYMRGVDFYNVPTTLLAAVDSSIGGKTAIDFSGVKNILGAFHQPRAVVIDPELLKTLPERHIAAGLAEVVKMAMTHDKELFEMLEDGLYRSDVSEIIYRALMIKKKVVEADERESGERKKLNFGHTFGHGIEALGGLYHGECIALGMIPMTKGYARERLTSLLSMIGLPTEFSGDFNIAEEFMMSDKKGKGAATDAVFVDEIGSSVIKRVEFSEITRLARDAFEVTK